MVAGVAVLSVMVVGALLGVVIAFLLSLVDLIARASRPHAAVLVELPGGQGFDTPTDAPVTMTRPGLVIYRFDSSIYFANATFFRKASPPWCAKARRRYAGLCWTPRRSTTSTRVALGLWPKPLRRFSKKE